MSLMKKPNKQSARFLWLAGAAGLLTAGSIGACSSSSTSGEIFDAGPDGTTSVGDAATDAAPLKDSGAKDTGVVQPGSCPAQTLAGECDLVLQNCGAGKECVPVNSGTAIVATCEPAGTGSTPLGHECCQNGPNNGNCVAGLFCNASCDVTDGGPGTKSGRCSPFCCLGDDKKCGESDPEGIKGTCSVTVSGQNPFDGGQVDQGGGCVYATACKPFGVQPCTDPTAICTVQTDGVTFRCEQPFQQPPLAAGVKCQYENECANGLECIGAADAGACTYPCYQANQDGGPPPFDASVLNLNVAGQGGCPSGQTCRAFVTGWAGWYGLCSP